MTGPPAALYACAFGAGGPTSPWPRLARVLAYTGAQRCPGWTVTVETIAPPPAQTLRAAAASHLDNTHKLDRWCAIVAAAPDDARVVLIDADTMILRPLDDVWALPFDVAITVKAQPVHPINAGVVFVRVSARTRAWLEAWRDENRRMLHDARHHQVWRRTYGGINQAALGAVLASTSSDVALAQLPCREWNCEDSSWRAFDPDITRIVHLKSQLRLAVFHGVPAAGEVRRLATLWRSLEREAIRGAAP